VDLIVDLSQRGDRSTVLYRALLDALRQGRLTPGDRLPPSRALAVDLGISRATVATVYERLVAEGHLVARVGAGTFVSEAAALPTRRRRRTPDALRPRASWAFDAQPVSGSEATPPCDFRVGIPDAGLFPFDTWRRLLAAASRRSTGAGTYAPPEGHPALRAALARHLAYSRGVSAEPDDVLVTHGTQQALDLVARVMLEPGDVVVVEDPGYPYARALFTSHGARVIPVPVDEEGLLVDALPRRARLVFTTPSHQFPLGPPLSLARRHALLAFASRHDTVIIEDDYDSEFRYVERPLDPLHSLDQDGRVLYVGTFSKSLLPSLRAGYLLAPPSLRSALRGAKQLSDGYGDPAAQLALARFLDDGLLARHLRTAAQVYAERRRLIDDGLAALGLDVVPAAAGLHLSAYLDASVDAGRLVRDLRVQGVVMDTLDHYSAGPLPRNGLVLGYGATVTESVRPGIRLLGQALEAQRQQ
jgi:GntR family transcriptional regulator/MocR family aminotransferase